MLCVMFIAVPVPRNLLTGIEHFVFLFSCIAPPHCPIRIIQGNNATPYKRMENDTQQHRHHKSEGGLV
ncbi:unnamed protein product [Peronospora effusa]|nr:unnamed protein product [Peronospora effusa]